MTTISTKPMASEDIIVNADAQGLVEGDLSLAQPVSDDVNVTIIEEEQAYPGRAVIKPNVKIKIDTEIKLDSTKKLKVAVDISKLEIEYKVNTLEKYAYIAVSGESKVKGSASFDFWAAGGHPKSLDLIKIPVAGVGNITVAMEYSLTGTVSLTYTGDFIAGLEYSGDSGFRLVKNFTKKSFSMSAEIEFKTGIKASLGFDLVVFKGDIYAKAGVKLSVKSSVYGDNKAPYTCIHQSGHLYASVGAEAKLTLGVWSSSVGLEHEIFTEKNSPVRMIIMRFTIINP